MAISKEEISEIRNSVNIADFIGQFVSLRKVGRNFSGLCPFHSEKTPSFNVNPSKGIFKCFGCGKGGSVFDFVMDYRQVGFVQAVKEVAEYAGIVIQLDPAELQVKESPNAKLYEINNQASYLYENYLLITEQGAAARKYLFERGVDERMMKLFNIGLSPDLTNFLYQSLSNKYDSQTLANSGLFNYSNQQAFDVFNNRLMFAIHDQNGQTIGFSGRVWQKDDERPGKYVNTTTTPIFEKSDVLYNLDHAKASVKKSKEVYLMEGFMDVIAAHKAGLQNVVAIMGTALTERHVKTLSFFAKKIILVTDGDKAGQAAIEKSLKVIHNLEVQIVKIPDAQDPDEYAHEHGSEALLNLLENFRMSESEFLMDYLRPMNLDSVVNQLEFLQTMAPILAKERNQDAQTVYMRRLVEILPDFEYNQIEQAVKNTQQNEMKHSGGGYSSDYFPPYPEVPAAYDQDQLFNSGVLQSFTQQKLSRSEMLERQLLQRMIQQPELIARLSTDASVRFQNSDTDALFGALIIEQMTTGTIDPTFFPESLEGHQRELYYDILSLNLPETFSEEELQELLQNFKRESVLSKIEKLSRQGVQAKKEGNQQKELEMAQEIVAMRQQLQRGQI
ncbi:MAG: DNA primase [Streptococcaceae bacterium]|nr:DNA primase [Streptococcaceae bacterium]